MSKSHLEMPGVVTARPKALFISRAENAHALGREKAGALFHFPVSLLSSGARPFDIGSSETH